MRAVRVRCRTISGWLGRSGSGTPARLAVACLTACAAAGIVVPVAWAAPSGASAAATPPPIWVINRNDSGYGSLRWAIGQANQAAPGVTTVIDFSVTGVIRLSSALPAISASVSIDGESAPGYVAGGPPLIEVDCQGNRGLRFSRGSQGSQLLGLAVDSAGGDGVSLGAAGITLNADYIGVSLTGWRAGNRGAGVYVTARSSGDRIGLNESGDPGVIGNVISGNGGSGIVLAGAGQATVAANHIGTNVAGSAGMGNGGDGILITGHARGNLIGGTEFTDPLTGQENNPTGTKGTVPPVFVVPPLGNLISANKGNGVEINRGSRGNVLSGNFIGTTAAGDAALGNAGNGVWIDDASRNSLIGCKFVNNPFVYYNVLSGNRKNGLRITSSDNVVVQANFFGIGANNTTLIGNRLDGILVDGSSARTQVGGVIPLGNVSAGNGRNGIEVAGRVRNFTTFNTFGGLLAFKGAAPNGNDGLLITSTGRGNLVRTNVFSGNRHNGIELAGRATGVTVDPDIVGLTTNGQAVLANDGDGLLIDGSAHGNVIGGSLRSVIPQDTFSGNLGYGIAILGRAHGNRIFSSFIGTNVLGVKRLGNRAGGVLIGGRAYGNVLGDARTVPANLVSGNHGIGVTLGFLTWGNAVVHNYIGLGRRGHRLPNSGPPVVNRGRHNVIRGNRS
jgi:parallel beta-helix repeat protein